MVENKKPHFRSGSFSSNSFSSESFTLENFHYVSKPDEKIIGNVSGQNVNISGEVKEVEIKTPDNSLPQINISFNQINYNSFNPTMNQNMYQDNSIENIITLVNNQQNISTEDKSKLNSQVKEFEQESKKNNPNDEKLRNILNTISPIAKEIAVKLFVHALDIGILKF